MKHGLVALALACWLAGIGSAEGTSGSPMILSALEMKEVEGGDLFLYVDRDNQMMTVTRITPGSYDNIESYSVKVTTSVVRNKDVTPENPKNAMENIVRDLKTEDSSIIPKGETRTPTQFPSGPATVLPVVTTQPGVTGPVIQTKATQMVKGKDQKGNPILAFDWGYNVHFVDPKVSTNTLGCIGVQSLAGMEKVVESLEADNATATAEKSPVQIIIVTTPSREKPATKSKPVFRPYTLQTPKKAL